MNRFKLKLPTILLALGLFLASLFAFINTTPTSAIPFFDGDDETSTPTDNTTDNPDTNPTDTNNTTNPDNPTTPDDSAGNEDENNNSEDEEDGEDDEKSICAKEAGSLYWIVCPASTFMGSLIDGATDVLHDFFEIDAISTENNSPVYLVWQYMRNLTNIVFIIFILIVIYSQLTGLGLNNYGIKRVLPRIIIAVILVNLSFIICTLIIDVSNIIGDSIIKFCQDIQLEVLNGANPSKYNWTALVAEFVAGAVAVGLFAGFSGGLAPYFFMLLPILIAGLISIAIGLITIAARQALVALLVMVAPLAFLAYLLPNTEKWFNKWRELLGRMLIFYPMFSFLVGASQLLGSALIIAATSPFGTLIGYAVKVVPIFFAFSLMKMSGTILGSLNTGLHRLASPINTTAAGWASSHAERRRQDTILNSPRPGARLRRYLDYKKAFRDADTANTSKARQDKATARALIDISRSLGYGEHTGHAAFHRRASRYTQNAKLASYYETRASTAKDILDNTLSEYGEHFGGDHDKAGKRAKELSDKHAEAFLDAMSQKFLAANIAQGDQNFLLQKYLDASTSRNVDPRAYHRLIKSSASSLGHLGEASIMGQVISESARIEQRRRSEARIIANKFGINKPDFRGMIFDCESINDDGYETDENGKQIEDSNYRLKKDATHRHWKNFVAVHKDTRNEITEDQYNSLSAAEKSHYDRVNYMNIYDDKGRIVQQVFADDAGYMKELLADDITIGDPITQRYAFSIGRGLTDEEKETLRTKYHVNIPENYNDDWAKRIDENGALRRYSSVISSTILSSGYKDHNSALNPMLMAQARNGYIRTVGQFYISSLDSLAKATKPGAFLKNDPYAIQTLARLINSVVATEEGERFEDLIPNIDIETFLNVNKLPLKGLRLTTKTDENGRAILDANGKVEEFWKEVDRTNSSITLEDRKNYVKHGLIPVVARKLVGMMDRNLSSGILEGQKPGTYDELLKLLDVLEKVGMENIDPNIDIVDKLNPENDIFAVHDPREMRDRIRNTKNAIRLKKQAAENSEESFSSYNSIISGPGGSDGPGSPNGSGGSGGSGGYSGGSNNGSSHNSGSGTARSNPQQPSSSSSQIVELFREAYGRTLEHSAHEASANDIHNIVENVYDICNSPIDLENACDLLLDYLGERSVLSPYYGQIRNIIERYRNGTNVKNRQDIEYRARYQDSYEEDLLLALYRELISFLQTIFVN